MRGSIKGRHRKRFISVLVPKLHSCGSNPTSGGTNFPGGAQSFSSPVKSRSQPNRKHTHTRYEPSLARMLHARRSMRVTA